ncbi:MAG: MoaD/ThiS family protein [Anaerolineales bacterium]|nr:MoaD/ThiS family protein [Anaerolineales bacterium]
MKVYVKLLATYRKLLPPEADDYKFEVEIPTGITVAALMSHYGVPLSEESVFLVNGVTPKSLDQELVEGDTVAAFSAMAGG